MKDKITASEALFGFVGWLTSRKEKITMSSSDLASEPAELVQAFIDKNELTLPRDNYTDFYELPEL